MSAPGGADTLTRNPREAAAMIGCSEKTVRRLIKAGLLAAVPHLPTTRIAVCEIRRFCEATNV